MNHSTCALATNLDEVERAREGVVGVVGAQDRERLTHGLGLLRAGLRALLELLVRHLAGLLQVHQELLVRRQGVAGVFEVLVSKYVWIILDETSNATPTEKTLTTSPPFKMLLAGRLLNVWMYGF